ncbi:L-fucose:H+ symporter permease [Granulicella arctica]|uniref:FHS family L-fucose permease-like MFS transporter n=1 Tax=Granulicella arctica TaxID=940613 RepID=A0A7Y9TFQ5_9BACT|nr:L-fucose:H+ symporter permease [Granulicella arctica]NYF77890.1 FHS family L-fucose permease-like MFS transporter [Granulicella arctica]
MLIAPASDTTAGKGSGEPKPLLPIGNLAPFFLVTSLFFLWAIPNNLNDILIRQFMKSFSLTRFQGGLVQSAFYMGYFLLAIPAALLMRRAGYKAGILTGLLLFATGTFLFWPAAIVGQYWFFLLALFVMASGLSFLETASNPFIAQIGASESSERRLNFSQAFNPLGAITGAGVGTIFILSGVELTKSQVAARIANNTYAAYLRTETLRVVAPYIVLGLIALVLAAFIWQTKFPVIQSEHEGDADDHGHIRDLFRQRHFVLAILAQFLYVGAQVGTWSYFIQYVQDYTHQPEKIAGYFLVGTLAAFGVGRFSSSWLMQFIPAGRLMGSYALINILLLVIAIAHPGWIGLWCVFGTSLFMSVMFPTIFALGLKGLGANTKIGGSMLVMAIVGGAILTPIMGLISEKTGSIAAAYLIPLIGYVVVALYAFFGSKPRRISF